MASCAYCGGAKAKRACPALGGAICSPCCGRHRLQEIECPADCVWLGGLRVVRDPMHAPVATHNAWTRAIGKLFDYAKTAEAGPIAEEAIALVYPDGRREVSEWEYALLVAFMAYGHRSADGRRLVDRFIALRGRALPPDEMAALLAQQRAWAGLFEIVKVHTGVGLDLRDLISGEAIHVKEVSATAQARKGDVILAWVVELEGRLEFTGAACSVPREHVAVVFSALLEELERAGRRRPGVPERDLVGEIVWAPIVALREACRNVRLPELRNMQGEELCFSKAHYRSTNDGRVRDALASLPDLEPTDDGFVWLDRKGRTRLGEGSLTLGAIRISNGRVTLETNSRERLDRGKRMLETALKGLVQHQVDSVQDVESAMRRRRDQQKREEAEIPDEVKREIVGRYLQQHYERWLDEPIPALGGKSPRKAVKTRKGRARVAEMLDEIEHNTARMDGGDAVDFGALRRELGFVEADDDSVDYDASVGPDPKNWLQRNDEERARAVEKHHRALAGHPDTPNPRAHARMHVLVENQLAAGEPPEVRATLVRLLAAGLARHEAVHAIGSIVAGELAQMLKQDRAFDRAAVARALSGLRPTPSTTSIR